MAKFARDQVMDNALSVIADNVNYLTVCTEQPGTIGSAITQASNLLARHFLSAGDYTIGDGDSSGRKITIAQQTSITVSATGNGNHVALVEVSAGVTTLYYVTTATSQELTSGNTLTVNSFDIEIADPS